MPTVEQLLTWLNSNAAAPDDYEFLDGTPSSDYLELVETCLNAAIAQLEAVYVLPESYTDDVHLAVLYQAAFLLQGRNAPTGTLEVGEFGPLTNNSHYSPQAKGLLKPYKRYPMAL